MKSVRTIRLVLLAMLGLAFTAPSARAQIQPIGPAFQVNTYTTNSQQTSHVATDAAGNFVIVWQSQDLDGSSWNIYERRFDAAGGAIGAEFRVNTYTTGLQEFRAVVACDAAGNHTVAWGSSPEFNPPNYEVKAQRHDAAGNRLGGEFQVNTGDHGWDYQPAITSDPAGNVVVVWHASPGTPPAIWARRYAPSGAPVGFEFRVDSYPANYHDLPVVASDGAAGFVVAWRNSETLFANGRGVGVRAYSAAHGLHPEIQASSCEVPSRFRPAVAHLGARGFVVAFPRAGGLPIGTVVQVFDPTGLPVTREILVAPAAGDVEVIADPPDRFVVVWRDGFMDTLAGRVFDADGVVVSDAVPLGSGIQYLSGAASQPGGRFVLTWTSPDADTNGVFARLFAGVGSVLEPRALAVDAGGDRVLHVGDTAALAPSWRNPTPSPITVSGTLTGFGGPTGATYTIVDGAADYGAVGAGQTASCTATGDCYALQVTAASRPAAHWDAAVTEALDTGTSRAWPVHVGDSFADVPRARGDHRFVEALLHHGVTAGCGAGAYCPDAAISREQMAVFLRVAREGAVACAPLPCTPGSEVFTDVPASSPYCRWIEELARLGATGGCGGGRYCPSSPVRRQEMAVFVVRTRSGAAFLPPACTPGSEVFTDVPASSVFCPWIEELARRNVVTGCGGGNYCPSAVVTRGEMAVFLGVAFGLSLYGP